MDQEQVEQGLPGVIASTLQALSAKAATGDGKGGSLFEDGDARRILEALPAAVYTTDADGYLTYFNEQAAELWGYRPEIGRQRWCGTFKIFLMDGTLVPHDQCPMATAVRSGQPVYGIEAIGERPDGKRVPCAVFPTPLFDDKGRVVGGINMLVDISARKKLEEEQSVLLREMDHRIKNNLATIQAIMGSTIRSTTTMREFQQAFSARIASLAKTNALLTRKPSESVSLKQLFRNELDMYLDGAEGQAILKGPEVTVPAQTAVPLGMAIHELTTNSVKYGSLSVLGGVLSIAWTEHDGMLDLHWLESGVPSVKEPSHEGFGSQLLRRILPNQLNAVVDMHYNKDGIKVRFKIPIQE